MRKLGGREIRPISFNASPRLFLEGCMFNEQIHKLPSGSETCFPKGVYRYESHEQSNLHWEECLAEKMAQFALNNE